MSNTTNRPLRLAMLVATVVCCYATFLQATEQRVNPALVALHDQQTPTLTRVGERVYASMFYEYSNFAFIEGDDGIIVVDTGWFKSGTQKAFDDLRALTDKPIVAVIYTHSHRDHTGGASILLEGVQDDIPIYAPFGWQRAVNDRLSPLTPTVSRRIYLQMGMLLPRGPEGTVGQGIGPSPIPEPNEFLSHPPNIEINEPTDVTIAGVKMQILPMQGDMPENIWVWLPEDKILFVGDAPPHGVFPAIETARFEIDRDPYEMLHSVEHAIALAPEYIVPGHSRLLRGTSDVRHVLNMNRDAISWVIDQVDRYYLQNKSVEQLLAELELPTGIASDPDLQPGYHRWEWMVRQRYIKQSGFIDDSMDYLKLNEVDEALRLVPLLGGRERVLALANQLTTDDPRWAARLATYLLLLDPDDNAAAQARQAAFLSVAQTTLSANERNYMLGLIKEERGEIDFSTMLAPLEIRRMKALSTSAILRSFKSRFATEDAGQLHAHLQLHVDGVHEATLQVRNGVLYVDSPQPATNAETPIISLSRETLESVGARTRSWQQALNSKLIEVAGDSVLAKRVLALIE